MKTKSTGPKTEAGKAKSSQNALTHGLTAKQVVLPTEDLEAYNQHLAAFRTEYDPQGATEEHLVQSLADISWRENRIASLEAQVFSLPDVEAQMKALANLSLHSQRLSRQFERTVAQLRSLQQPRRDQEKQDWADYLDITDMYESKKETYDASLDGFVFSEDQIDQAILARNRRRSLEEVREFAD